MKPDSPQIAHPPQSDKPLASERGSNPAAEADTLPSESNPAPAAQTSTKNARKDPPDPLTANEIMNESVTVRDEQGDRMQSDRPNVSG